MTKTRKMLLIVLVCCLFLIVLLIIKFVSHNENIEDVNESVNKYIEESTSVVVVEESTTVAESKEVEMTTVDAPVEADEIDRDVENVIKNLVSDVRSNNYVKTYLSSDNIITTYENNIAYIKLVGCGSLGYDKDEILLYRVYQDGNVDTYPGLVELGNYIDKKFISHKVVDVDTEMFSDYNLSSVDKDWESTITVALNDVVLNSDVEFDGFGVVDKGSTEFVVYGESDGRNIDLLQCTIRYEDGFGTYLEIKEVE